MWRWIVLGIIGLAVVLFGFSLLDTSTGDTVTANAVLPPAAEDISGYTRAIDSYNWQFPADYGAHPNFQTEWWYYTGNLADEAGRRFGFQFTIFRRAIAPEGEAVTTGSEWRTNQLYMAHFAVTDVAENRFYHEQRFSREGAGLAGATDASDGLYRVWLEDWEAVALNDDASSTRVYAITDQVALDLTLDNTKPPSLQGDAGLSAKSAEPGNASYYYSLTRLLASGTLTVEGETFTVTGTAWKDHEFSTSALGTNALGWDWFGLQLDDNRELMIGQIRLLDGGRDPYFGGLLVSPDGTTRYLPSETFDIRPAAVWNSPHTGANYPARWVITIDVGDAEPLELFITPQIVDQELHGDGIAYWEGTVRISGDATGYGYAELTGYVDALTGRF